MSSSAMQKKLTPNWVTFLPMLLNRTHAYVHRKTVDEQQHFDHAFMVLNCCEEAYSLLKPKFLSADGAFLKGAVKGHLLALCAIDGYSRILPLALGVFPFQNECGVAWKQFVRAVRSEAAFGPLTGKTLITDRRTGLDAIIREEAPEVVHVRCHVHIKDNLRSRFRTNKFSASSTPWRGQKIRSSLTRPRPPSRLSFLTKLRQF
ncbi:putative uncharacterized protein LOC106350923 [Diplonema papillatum]|nr:putative uncharacterized protein LOC106350923 [Diplonema papillatum]